MKILVVGDIHGNFGKLNSLINKQKPDILFLLGDVAIFWNGKNYMDEIKTGNTKVYFLMGNHSDHDYAEEHYGRNFIEPIEITKNIYYCGIGSSLQVENKTILFAGGADSIDKQFRLPGRTWFQQEYFNNKDYNFIMNNYANQKIDIIMSHSCPASMAYHLITFRNEKYNDPSYAGLEELLDYFHPKKWYFGHFHKFEEGFEKGCKWTCLNTLSDGFGDYGKAYMEVKWN